MKIITFEAECNFQIIDPEEIIHELRLDSFLSFMKYLIFVNQRKKPQTSNAQKTEKVCFINENLENFFTTTEILSSQKSLKIKTKHLDAFFEIIRTFLHSNKIMNFLSLNNEEKDDFIIRILALSKNNDRNGIFMKFLNNLEHFLAICFVLFIDRLFEAFYKKQIEKIHSSTQSEIEQTFDFNDFSKLSMYENLSKRAKIHKLVIKIYDDNVFSEKTALKSKAKKINIYENFENEEDLSIFNILKEKEKNKFSKDLINIQRSKDVLNPFYSNNLMVDLDNSQQNNELWNNLLHFSNKMLSTFFNNPQMNIAQTTSMKPLYPPNVLNANFLNSSPNFNFLKGNTVLQMNPNLLMTIGFPQNQNYIRENGIRNNQKIGSNSYFNAKNTNRKKN